MLYLTVNNKIRHYKAVLYSEIITVYGEMLIQYTNTLSGRKKSVFF